MKRSDRLRQLADKVSGFGDLEDVKLVLEAAQTAARLEAGHGFTAEAIVNEELKPMIDISWMGMIAQASPDQARAMALCLMDKASEAETDLALFLFLKETGVKAGKAGEAIAIMRNIRRGLVERDPINAEKQEPAPLIAEPPAGSKPS